MSDAATPATFDLVPALATVLGLAPAGVAAVVAMLDEGSTVPFIARYRKERTGNLDEVQIRAIEEKRAYLTELEERRATILASVGEQGKLTPELETRLRGADNKAELEDLYAPFRPRRKTRASVAREKGLEPLAQVILAQGEGPVDAATYVTEQVLTVEDALAGARDIVAEIIADTAEVRAFTRREYAEHGELVSELVPGKDNEPTKFEQYYNFKEAVRAIPSHRFLAIRRGEAEGVVRAHVAVDTQKIEAGIQRLVAVKFSGDGSSPWAPQLAQAIGDALKRLLAPSVENDVRAELKLRSDVAAVDIFAGNLRNLMLAAPLGTASVIGVDPGLRTGCKCAAIDATGKFLGTVTVYITQGEAQLAKAKEDFVAFVTKFAPRAIAVGNGTGGREAEAFVKKALAELAGDRPFVVQVNEAGASVYSASDLAREEFPELDLTIRGAISIARRLQDPLAELVKIEPKSIGVGQYQHDVHQPLLVKKLGDVVESCVNHIGVELNTASAMLLGYVAGVGKSLAKKIVLHRDANGAFATRAQLLEVGGLGPKAFEQAAGFLRIRGAQHPLDGSAVHPERYTLVEQIASDAGVALPELIGNQELVDKIDFSKYVSDEVGEPTLRDIAAELGKPGRDPRAEFAPPAFRDDVTSMEDLKQGMVLEGIVTNVTAFGAFVDIGVHNDGLVHVSQLSEQFVKDPAEVVKVGQKLKVRVLEVDLSRKRIALSAKAPASQRPRNDGGGGGPQQQQQQNRGGGGGGRGPRGGNPQQQQQRGGGGGGGGGRGPRRDDNRGPRPQGEQQRSYDQRGPDQSGQHHEQVEVQHVDQPHDQPPLDQRGGDQPQQRAYGDRFRGNDNRGGGAGFDNRGNDNRGGSNENRGPDHRGGGDNRGPDNRGPDNRGPDNRGPDNRGPDNRGPDNRGPDNRGPDNRGPDNRGGGGFNRGGGGGPRRDDNRGPRNDGLRQIDNRGGGGGPRRDDNRGPRNDGPRGEGPRPDDRGPRRDDRGPRSDAPQRDDRPPPQPSAPPEKWGVAGFKNNPFAKLVEKPSKS